MMTEEEKRHEPQMRKQIFEKIKDLKKKIETNEPCPEQEQNMDLLVDISDYLDNCLDHWYY